MKKFKTRGELEAERRALEEEQKQKKLQEKLAQEKQQQQESNKELEESKVNKKRKLDDNDTTTQEKKLKEEDKESTIVLPSSDEVKRRLRQFREPIQLFGESSEARYERLKQVELKHHEYRENIAHGRKNIFNDILKSDVEKEIRKVILQDLEQQRKSQEEEILADIQATDGNHTEEGPQHAASQDTGEDKQKEGETKALTNEDKKHKKDFRHVNLLPDDFQTSNEFIAYFFKRMLSEWESELEARSKEIRMSVQGRIASATQKQTRQFMKPFFKLLKTEDGLSKDILKATENIAHECMKGNFIKADEYYLTMAIGNAAWPMGVTMVGIHERAGREKIFSNQVAHVLNDETQRKYIQSIKRLMTYCMEHYPKGPLLTGSGEIVPGHD